MRRSLPDFADRIKWVVIINVFVFSCCTRSKQDNQPSQQVTVIYKASEEDFPNPERGFYRYTQTAVNNFIPLNPDQLKEWRKLRPADGGGNYSIYSTLVFRYYILNGYKDALLPASFIDSISADFDIARQAGVKLIPRFAYTLNVTAGSCPEAVICPPYGDAPKKIVLQQINQLKPLFQKHADVMACLQMGFIGVWGENYYTDHFGDASANAQGKLYDNNWTDRSDVLQALLNAVPDDRMIQVRIPQMKQRFVYSVYAPTHVPALTGTEAFTQTDKARIGFHNDCLLSGADDYGTFVDYGNSSTPRQQDAEVMKAYTIQDSRYVVTGGETCDDTYSPQNDCENAGMAQTELRQFHYSYLNSAYNNDVNNDWQTGGCMSDIKKNLGYRFVLRDAIFPRSVNAGTNFTFSINLENKGYASPFNPRPLKLVMRKENSTEEFVFDLPDDVRKWSSGTVKVNASVSINSTMTKGRYELFLFLPDTYSTISKRPEYAIRLANEDMWEKNTGYNKLMATVTIR